MRPIWIEEDDVLMPIKRQASTTETQPTVTTPTSTTPPSTTSTPPSSTPTVTQSSSTRSTSSTPSTSSAPPSTTSTPPTSTSTTPRSTPTSLQLSTRSDGAVVTRTVTGPVQTTSRAAEGGNKGFFDNKAQVGAVFGVAGLVGLVFLFFLVTTCIRRQRAKKFDRDVAEAAAAAAAANADPFIGNEDERGGAHWDPRRTSAYNAGYGRINEDPYGYAAAGVVGGGPFARQPTHYSKRQNTYNMNDFSSSGGPSMYSGTTNYPSGGGGAGYYMDDYQQGYVRPSFSSTAAPGIAGVGSGGTATSAGGHPQDNQQLRYRGQPQNDTAGTEDAYGGYTSTSPEPNTYSGGYASNQPSDPYSRTTSSPPIPSRAIGQSPPPPPSYSGHGHGAPQIMEKGRPVSSGGGGGGGGGSSNAPLAMPPPNHMAYPPGVSGTPEESWNDNKDRILRVANE